MKFEELNLSPQITKALEHLNILTCTDIQKTTIPLALEGKDISGLSQTGTGKTFAFLIPLIERLIRTKNKLEASPSELDEKRSFSSWSDGHFILVMAPTRELADQTYQSVQKICPPESGIKSVLVYGGVEYEAQTDALSKGVDIVIGTPGRLIDLYKSHHINFRQIQAIVFDEADRMFDMGFKDDMIYILQRAPQDRQILMFSATLNFDVLNTAYRFGSNPIEVNISKDQIKADEVHDEIFHVGESEKPQFLLSLINKVKPKQTIIFSNFKSNIDRISKFLNSNGIPAVGISSLLTQKQRERVLEQFKNESERNTLVATDVAARGLDIKGVDLVINYDLPDDAENYIHRIGRTGRAGEEGEAFSLVSDRDVMALSRIEGYLRQKVTIGWLDDEFIIKDFKPLPRDSYREESHVRKTGLAAVAQDNSTTPRNNQRNSYGNKRPRPYSKERYHDNSEKSEKYNKEKDSSSPAQNDIHRDRRLGRHQSGSPKAGSQNTKWQNKSNGKPYEKSTFKKKANPTPKPSGMSLKNPRTSFRVKKDVGLTGKVKSFLKKIFE